MTRPEAQFVIHAHEKLRHARSILWCAVCCRQTSHRSTMGKRYRHYTCEVCGARQDYKRTT